MFFHKSTTIQSNSLCLLCAGFPTILDSFYGVANTTYTPIGLEGGGMWVAMKWQVKAMSSLKQGNGFHWRHFHVHMSHKATKCMAKPISQSCGDL